MMFEGFEIETIVQIELGFLLFLFAVSAAHLIRKKYNALVKSLALQIKRVEKLQRRLAEKDKSKRDESGMGCSNREHALLAEKLASTKRTLALFKHRVDNLEKFRILYFELEKHVVKDAKAAGAEIDADVFENTVKVQNKVVSELKRQLAEITDKHQLEASVTAGLKETIDRLKHSVNDLSGQLDLANHQQVKAITKAETLGSFRERVRVLEATEDHLKKELEIHRQQIQSLKQAEVEAALIRQQEVENITDQLRDKESELKRIRIECETIARQYESLALKSLQLSTESSGLTDQQKVDMETLKAELQESMAALARKNAECAMLEDSYLELEKLSEFYDSSAEMEAVFGQRQVLEKELRQITDEIEVVSNAENLKLLHALQEQLLEKEEELSQVRDEHQELTKQFVEVAREGVEYKSEFQRLKVDNKNLQEEVRKALKYKEELEEKEQEVLDLNDKYNKLEDRYLTVLEKQSE